MLGDTEAHVTATDLEAEYEILGELGRGATAVVYRARDRELGREVAIKVIRPKYADDEEAVARLAREARTVAQLQHPNIVTLYGVRRLRDGGLALIMQLVPGRTLRDALNERGAFTFERADRVLRDVANALAHAHARGIVHRDVKPENIFIDENTGHALLSDFGVARSLEPDSRLTATGTAIGTPAYMSPEQIDGTELDGRSDLYSLGLVGWEMLTGRRPWEGEGLYSVIYKQKREELQPIDELRPDTPDRLIYLVEGATRKRVADRWARAQDFLDNASIIAPEGGWQRWHAERRKRQRNLVYTEARQRGDSIMSAALETVRFRRGGPIATPRRVRGRDAAAAVSSSGLAVGQSAVASETDGESAPASARAEDTDADLETRALEGPRRRSFVPVLAVIAIVVAGIAGGARLIRGRAEPPAVRRDQATFADNGGVEVPVARPLPPNATSSPGGSLAAPDTSTKPPLGSSEAATPPAAAATSDTNIDPPATSRDARDTATGAAGRGGSAAASTGEVARSASALQRSSTPQSRPVTVAPPPTAPVAAAPTPDTDVFPAVPAVSTGIPARAITPPPVAPPVSFPAERLIVAAGGRHSCAVDNGGAAKCWGANDQGQLGDGTHEDHAGPTVVAGGLAFAQLSAGSSHTCGVTRDGDAYCWGNNERGQLGDATTLQRDTPVRVSGGDYRTVRAGFSHTCALSTDGQVSCWGSNAYGQLGTGAGLASSRPATVAGGLRFGAISVGWNHSCGVAVDGAIYCWGSNSAGQLGDGSRDDRRTPTRAAASARFVAVAAGNQHTCAVTTDGDIYCWGRNNYGQLGTGPGDRAQPTRVEFAGEFTSVAAGAVHTCARTSAGQLFCWGRNTFGQLGDGTMTDRSAPVRVVGLPAVAVVQATGAHTCAATSAGESFCWGYNVEGQLGDGTRNHQSRPARVSSTSR